MIVKNPLLPKTAAELMIQLVTQAQKAGNTLSPDEMLKSLEMSLNRMPQALHPVKTSAIRLPARNGCIPYDLVKMPAGFTNKDIFYIKPEMNEAESFEEVCKIISDRCSATQADVMMVMHALYQVVLLYLRMGKKFPFYPFGELTLSLKSDNMPTQYDHTPKEINIKSVQLVAYKSFLTELNHKAQFQRRRLYVDSVLAPNLRRENILNALSQSPYLKIEVLATLNHVSATTTRRDIAFLIHQQKVFIINDGCKKGYALCSKFRG